MNRQFPKALLLISAFSGSGAALAWNGNHTLYGDPLQVGAYIADVKPLIIVSAKRYGWTIKQETADRITVHLKRDGIEVDADILYDRNHVVLQSQGPRAATDCADRCEVTDQSSQWLVNLRRAIALELHALAIKDAGGNVKGRYFEPNLEEFRAAVMGDDARAIGQAAANISRGYIHEREFLDIAAARAWQLRDTSDKSLTNASVRLVKAISKSDGPRYKRMIAELAKLETDLKRRQQLTAILNNIQDSANESESYRP